MFETSAEPVAIETACVPLRVVDSGRRGRGVVAVGPIPRAALIERAPVIVIPEAGRAAADAAQVGDHVFMWEHGTTGEDLYSGSGSGRAALALGLVSLVNHSADPNCRIVRHIEARALDLVAIRDIAAGEELGLDYGMTLWFTPD